MTRLLLVGFVVAAAAGCGGQTAAGEPANAGASATTAAAKGPSCPASWLEVHGFDPSIAPPAGAGHVVLHVAATGTQDYACTAGDGGAAWKFVGPDAKLTDCNGAEVGHHFPSAGGAEWQLADGTFAVAHKTAQFVPDGKSGAVPWLLLQVVGHAETGALAKSTYVQRLNTTGGLQPTAGCSAETGTTKVPYTADYYFYGP